ncbi:MAG TPA: DUF1524 domain-containing protein [Pseudoclavibacter sp.]|nr:DUF1524 domain-containing protein [Pseudoclavibacter sp.]
MSKLWTWFTGLKLWVRIVFILATVAVLATFAPLTVVTSTVILAVAIVSYFKKGLSFAPFKTLKSTSITAIVAVVALAIGVAAANGTTNNSASDAKYSTSASPTPSESASASASASDETPLDTDSVVAANVDTSTIDSSTTKGETAVEVLETLPVKGRAAKTGYTRSQFGTAWEDVDDNGCDTRNDILKRDLTDITDKDSCKIATGTLLSAYSGETVSFVRGESTSSEVQIDHLVSLSDAWQTGAQQLETSAREALANDPLNLQAVEGSLNEQKGDGDAATWLPPLKSYRCVYVARQVSVKAIYGLWVTQAEHDAIATILDTCPDQQAYTSEYATTVIESASPSAMVTPTTEAATPTVEATTPMTQAVTPSVDSGSDVYYKNCDAVRAAGAAPLYQGQPGYSSKLDRDGDGVACEQ